MAFCPYCNTAKVPGGGDVFCSRHMSNFEDLQNGLFKIEGNNIHSEPHVSRFAVRFMIDGEMDIMINKKKHHVRKDEAVIFNQYAQYQLDISGRQEPSIHVGLAFNPSFIRSAAATFHITTERLLEDPETSMEIPYCEANHWTPTPTGRLWGRHVLSQVNSSQPIDRLVIDDSASRILCWYFSETSKHKRLLPQLSNIVKSSTRMELIHRLENAKALLEFGDLSTLAVKDLALAAHLSEFHFIRLYHQVYRISPYQHIQQKRMHQAWEWIIHTNKSIATIAAETGYGSVASFGRTFNKYYGSWPLQFRESSKVHK